MLILRKLICGGTSYTPLQIDPVDLRDIMFVAFHSNPVGDISMLLAHFIAFECAITGRKCFCTLKGCATCDQVAHSQIPHGVPLLTLFIISQSKHFFGCSLQMPTRLGNIQGLKEARLIYWCRMA